LEQIRARDHDGNLIMSEADRAALLMESAMAIDSMMRVASARETVVVETYGPGPIYTLNDDGSPGPTYYPLDQEGYEWFTYRNDGGKDVFQRVITDRNADGIIENEWVFKRNIDAPHYMRDGDPVYIDAPVIQPDGYNGPRYTGPDSPSQEAIADMMAKVNELSPEVQELLRKYQDEASLRARNPDGTFIADDPATPEVNEAWADGVGPTPTEES
jgi:hypothetical protein